MGHFHVDAAAVVAHAEEHALGARVQAEADGQMLRLYHRTRPRGLQVMPEHAAAQGHVEARKERHRGIEGPLQGGRIHLVGHGGRQAEDGLVGAARLGGVELADVV